MTMRYDKVELKATRNDAGFIHDTPILTRTGVFVYRDASGKERREYRPASSVFAKDSLDAYRGLPITDGHLGKITARNVRAAAIGTVMSPGRQDSETNLLADLVIHDTSPIDAGRKELSVGYEVEFDETPGTSPEGERYDAIQISIRPNHLAVVKKGRAGTARLNLDAADAADNIEEEPAMNLVKVNLDGINYDAAPEVARALEKAQGAAKEATTLKDQATARADAAEATIKTHDASLAKLRQDAKDEALGRVKMESQLAGLKIEFKQDASDRELRELVVKKHQPTLNLDGKSDDYVNALFDIASIELSKGKTNVAEARKQMNSDSAPADKTGERSDAADKPSDSANSARARYIEQQRGRA